MESSPIRAVSSILCLKPGQAVDVSLECTDGTRRWIPGFTFVHYEGARAVVQTTREGARSVHEWCAVRKVR